MGCRNGVATASEQLSETRCGQSVGARISDESEHLIWQSRHGFVCQSVAHCAIRVDQQRHAKSADCTRILDDFQKILDPTFRSGAWRPPRRAALQ